MADASCSELDLALRRCRTSFAFVAVMSGLINLLYLTGAFFMLQVYDRVLPSRSMPTLIGLLILVLALYLFQGFFDAMRGRILASSGASLDHSLSERIFDLAVRSPLKGVPAIESVRPLRDLDAVRGFLGSGGPSAFFDLPWIPIYLIICVIFHPFIGLAALAGTLILVAVTWATDRMTGPIARVAMGQALARNALADAARRNADSVAAMGMQPSLNARYLKASRHYGVAQLQAANIAGGFGAASKAFRAAFQSGVLALGAWLVIDNKATAGVIIAGSILTARAMAPAEAVIANWKSFVQARQAWSRLQQLCLRIPAIRKPHALPRPNQKLVVEAVGSAPPGAQQLVVQEISFALKAGQGLGIIGPSGSGKSTLAKALVGIWPSVRGRVCLDGAALDQWTSASLGPHLGYLPQEVELFAGTISENIARFRSDVSPDKVIDAARLADVHDLILSFPKGYDTLLADNGSGLSGGQRQRIGLARALFGEPFFVVLDEPNSNLDQEGEQALTRAIVGVRERGGICVIIAHRPSALAGVDQVLVMAGGRAQAFGPKNEILKQVFQPVRLSQGNMARGPAAPQQASVASGAPPITMTQPNDLQRGWSA